MVERIFDVDIVLTNKVVIDRNVFEKCPNLKYIWVTATGYNIVDVTSAVEFGVIVTNVPAYSTDSVS
ncbi:Rossmann-fold NAD(P)-binding domain-containing protein [Methanococcus vannielii]|uniref:hypothetical protein n=1 Tax=Methanococcus vannielii TaxID=2187 RepID=UPI0000F0A9F4|nr:hypothetical protein [Methanococcus vannielii]